MDSLKRTYLIVFLLFHLFSLVGQNSGRFGWLGSGVAPTESYLFVEADGFAIPGYASMYHGNLVAGYQKNAWLGVGVHFSAVTPSSVYKQHQGFGLSYRLAYRFLEFRADVGVLTKYEVWDDYCSFDYELDTHPYFNAWVGFWVFRVVRLGGHISLVPSTIQATRTCYHGSGTPITSVEEQRLGSLFALPSIGLTIPLFRSKQ